MFLVNPYIYSTTAWENLKSISFDGVDEYVDIGRVTETESATNLSFSCWIKSLDLSSDKVIFGKFNSASNNLYGVVSADGSLYFVLSNGVNYGAVYTAASEVVTNTWYHIAMVYDGSLTGNTNRAKVYINGVNKTYSTASSINSTTSSSTTSLHLGVRGGDLAGYYDGNIDEVSIFDYSLSQSEVTAIWNSGCPDNLMSLAEAKRPEHYYRMGDGDTFPTLLDSGETGGNNGTMTNSESGDINESVPL
jgi:hypothetical protein